MQISDRIMKAGDQQYSLLKDIKPGMKNLHIMFIVLEVGKATRTKDGHDVRSVKVADKTGSMNVSVWDETGTAIQTGDICKFARGYASIWKGCLTLYTGKIGEILKIGEFCLNFVEIPNFSDINPDLTKTDPPQRKSPTEDPNSPSAYGDTHNKGQPQGHMSSNVRPQGQPGNGPGNSFNPPTNNNSMGQQAPLQQLQQQLLQQQQQQHPRGIMSQRPMNANNRPPLIHNGNNNIPTTNGNQNNRNPRQAMRR